MKVIPRNDVGQPAIAVLDHHLASLIARHQAHRILIALAGVEPMQRAGHHAIHRTVQPKSGQIGQIENADRTSSVRHHNGADLLIVRPGERQTQRRTGPARSRVSGGTAGAEDRTRTFPDGSRQVRHRTFASKPHRTGTERRGASCAAAPVRAFVPAGREWPDFPASRCPA